MTANGTGEIRLPDAPFKREAGGEDTRAQPLLACLS